MIEAVACERCGKPGVRRVVSRGPRPKRRRAYCSNACRVWLVRADDPARARQIARDNGRRYYARHGVEIKARLRERYAADPSRAREALQRRRALKKLPTAEAFRDSEIFDRDAWTCGLCGGPVDRALAWPDPGSVSLDHVVALSRGGQHTRANVQCAHLRCNHAKNAGRRDLP